MVDIYNFIFDKISDSVVVLDKSGNILCSNNAFSEMSDEMKVFGIDLAKALSEKAILLKNKIELKNSKNKSVEISINSFEYKDNIVLILRNNSSLKDIDRTHIDFISTVSHELRTPLTSIKGFVDTLLSAGDKLDRDSQIRFLKIIKSQVERLTRLVENLLAVSKFESGKSENVYKEINVRKAVRSVIESLMPKYEKYKFHNDVETYFSVLGDSDKFMQIMTNLIDNAAKYSKDGSDVWIRAYFNPDNQNLIDIEVKDEGVGVPKEFYDKIFTRFSRIDNPLTRSVQGTGLGLYITKSLVESMNGKISVHGNGSKAGSSFVVSLPAFSAEISAGRFYQE